MRRMTESENRAQRRHAKKLQQSIWDLQLFTEEGEQGSADPEDGGDSNGKNGENDHEKNGNPKTFTQDQVNEMIEKRIARERAKLKEETDKAVKTAQEEAAKLAKMNADQKKEYESQKKDEQIARQKEEIEQLKAEALRAELSKQVGSELQAEGYPATVDVMEFVVGKDADETKARKDRFIAIIQADRKAQAEKRATGNTPKQYGNGQKPDPFTAVMKKYKN